MPRWRCSSPSTWADEYRHRELRPAGPHIRGRHEQVCREEADGEGKQNASGRDGHVLPRVDGPEIAFEADQEQEEDRPQAGEGGHEAGVEQTDVQVEAEDARTEEDAQGNLPDDRGLSEPLDREVAQGRQSQEDRELLVDRLDSGHRVRNGPIALKFVTAGPGRNSWPAHASGETIRSYSSIRTSTA